MTDHAAVVDETLCRYAGTCSGSELLDYVVPARAALVALVAERDEARRQAESYADIGGRLLARAEDAEAERDRLISEGLTDLTNCARMLNESVAERDRLKAALRGKCDCGHVHDRDSGCGDCSCWGWTCAALEGTDD
jgi:hypothetical protein